MQQQLKWKLGRTFHVVCKLGGEKLVQQPLAIHLLASANKNKFKCALMLVASGKVSGP